jgi:hypothetical protein
VEVGSWGVGVLGGAKEAQADTLKEKIKIN